MLIPQRVLTGTCEISAGTLSILQRPPIFTGESSALIVQVSFTLNGQPYAIQSGCEAELYLKFPNTDKMTVAVPMTISGNTASGVLSAEQTGLDGYPLLVVQLTDTISSALIVACATTVKVSNVRGNLVVDTRAPSPSEIVYVGRSPYINPDTDTWMEWNADTQEYIDTGIDAHGSPATFTATAETLAEGSEATATISGTPENPILELGIPKGDKGEKGDKGDKGEDGIIGYTPNISIGTVESVPDGQAAEVTRTGTDEEPVLNFKLPRSGAGVGIYAIDKTIAVEDWEGDGPYTFVITDTTIASGMVILETWLTDEKAMLGETSYAVAEDTITITTAVKPQSEWQIHFDLGRDGTEVLAAVENIKSAVGDLENLETTDKTSVVSAVNEVFEKIENLRLAEYDPSDNSIVFRAGAAEYNPSDNSIVINIGG